MAVRPINAINLKKYIQGLDVSLPYDEQDKEDIIKQVCCIIDNWPTLTPPNEWVNVEERLPPPKQNVLAYSPESGIAEADYGDGVWMQYRWSAVMRGITHWMLLPVPPAKRGGDR